MSKDAQVEDTLISLIAAMKVSHGRIADRPWGVTLGALGAQRITGQLDLVTDDLRAYSIAFENGSVVAARAPDTHEPDTSRMRPQQVVVARARALVQAVALTFEATTGDYTIDDASNLPAEPPIDIREAIYVGAKTYLANDQLDADLRSLGERFMLKSSVTAAELEAYGLADDIEPIAATLRAGATLAELEAAAPDAEPADVHAMIYALVSGGACESSGSQPQPETESGPVPLGRVGIPDRPELGHTPREVASPRTQPVLSRTSTPNRDVTPSRTAIPNRDVVNLPRTPTPNRDVVARTPAPNRDVVNLPRTATPNRDVGARTPAPNRDVVNLPRTQTPNRDAPRPSTNREVVFPAEPRTKPPVQRDVVYPRAATQPGVGRSAPPRSEAAIARLADEAEAALALRQDLIDQGADHFAMLGLVFDAPIEAVRAAYFNLSRLLHPDRLAEIGKGDDPRGARVFGRINAAFNTLTSPSRRAEYLQSLRGPSTDPAATTAADDHFRRAEAALARDNPDEALPELAAALALRPDNLDFLAAQAWARFCAAADRDAIAAETRATLSKAAQRADDPVAAHLYLGRVERMLGRDRHALMHFEAVVALSPGHEDATGEIRMIEARQRRR